MCRVVQPRRTHQIYHAACVGIVPCTDTSICYLITAEIFLHKFMAYAPARSGRVACDENCCLLIICAWWRHAYNTYVPIYINVWSINYAYPLYIKINDTNNYDHICAHDASTRRRRFYIVLVCAVLPCALKWKSIKSSRVSLCIRENHCARSEAKLHMHLFILYAWIQQQRRTILNNWYMMIYEWPRYIQPTYIYSLDKKCAVV